MRRSMPIFAAVLFAVAWLSLGSVCHAGVVTFTIDPEQSYLTVSGSYSGYDFEPQNNYPGSMTAHFSGTIVADESGGALTFSGGSSIVGLRNRDLDEGEHFLPLPIEMGNIDSFGVKVPLGILDFALADGVFRDVHLDITSGTVTDGAVPLNMEISLPSYVFAYEVYYVEPDKGESLDDSGPQPNTTTLAASLTTVGTLQTLTIPILRATKKGEDPIIILEGQLVGTRVVPEPATWALMGLGMIGLVAAARRKSRTVA